MQETIAGERHNHIFGSVHSSSTRLSSRPIFDVVGYMGPGGFLSGCGQKGLRGGGENGRRGNVGGRRRGGGAGKNFCLPASFECSSF